AAPSRTPVRTARSSQTRALPPTDTPSWVVPVPVRGAVMDWSFSRRGLLHGLALTSGTLAANAAGPLHRLRPRPAGWVFGRMTGSEALAEALLAEGVGCVYGIPGAQENELWDTFKSKGLPYLLVTHEFSAAAMADGYARSTGKPGVLCVVPGPGVTNSLGGVGEALLDSIPLVYIVGDVARG